MPTRTRVPPRRVEEVGRLYEEHADAAATAAFDAAQQHPHRRLALMLGRARGIELPWALASAHLVPLCGHGAGGVREHCR